MRSSWSAPEPPASRSPPAFTPANQTSTSRSLIRPISITINPAGHWSAPAFSSAGQRRAPCLAQPARVDLDQGRGRRFEPENAVILEGCRVVNYRAAGRRPGPQARLGRDKGSPRRSGRTASHPITVTISRLIPGSWCAKAAAGRRSSPSLPCPSNAPGRRKRRCISRPTIGGERLLNNIASTSARPVGVLFGVTDYVPALMEYVSVMVKLDFQRS